MSGLETAAGGALVKVAIERAAPAGLAAVRSWIRGKTILVVGPSGAGKTTFIGYLQFGLFQHQQEAEPTYRPKESSKFNLRIGRDQNLDVLVKTVVDLPGQYADMSEIAFAKRPHAVVILLDLSQPLRRAGNDRASATWLEGFMRGLDQRWQNQKRRRNRLRTIIVVMNKMDLVDAAMLERATKSYKEIVDANLHASEGPKFDRVRFKPCVLVENADGTKWIDAVLISLAESLAD